MAMKAIWARTAGTLLASVLSASSAVGAGCVLLKPAVTPIIATRNWQISIPRAPHSRIVRRPNLSTVQKERGVDRTLTRVKISDIRNVFSMAPVDLRKGVE
jgi:hypothetical protein